MTKFFKLFFPSGFNHKHTAARLIYNFHIPTLFPILYNRFLMFRVLYQVVGFISWPCWGLVSLTKHTTWLTSLCTPSVFMQSVCTRLFPVHRVCFSARIYTAVWGFVTGRKILKLQKSRDTTLTVCSPVATVCTATLTFNSSTFCPHRLYLCVLCGSENKQRLFPYTTLTDGFV